MKDDTAGAGPVEPTVRPEPVDRLLRYAGQTMRTARSPNITAREAITVGNWLAAMDAELAEWRKLRDPANLHVNLLRGQPAQLTREQAMHLCADDLQRMAELEAVAKHEADCAEAFKAEAESLRKDAERYRHLRRPDVDIEGCALIYCTGSLDEMVDASIEAFGNIARAELRDDLGA